MEIAFPELHAIVAQNCVSGRGVEEKVRDDEVHQIALAFELALIAPSIIVISRSSEPSIWDGLNSFT